MGLEQLYISIAKTDKRHTMAIPFRAIAWDGKNAEAPIGYIFVADDVGLFLSKNARFVQQSDLRQCKIKIVDFRDNATSFTDHYLYVAKLVFLAPF